MRRPFLEAFAAEGLVAEDVCERLRVWCDILEADGAGGFAAGAWIVAGGAVEQFWHFEGEVR